MKTDNTPLPWHTRNVGSTKNRSITSNPRIEIIGSDGTIITDLTLSVFDTEHNAEQRANAHLIVSAVNERA